MTYREAVFLCGLAFVDFDPAVTPTGADGQGKLFSDLLGKNGGLSVQPVKEAFCAARSLGGLDMGDLGGGWRFVHQENEEFEGRNVFSGSAFVRAFYGGGGEIALVFRGTATPEDLRATLRYWADSGVVLPEHIAGVAGIRTGESGEEPGWFLDDALFFARSALQKCLARPEDGSLTNLAAFAARQGYEVVLLGHSLGGLYAQHLNWRLRALENVRAELFLSPGIEEMEPGLADAPAIVYQRVRDRTNNYVVQNDWLAVQGTTMGRVIPLRNVPVVGVRNGSEPSLANRTHWLGSLAETWLMDGGLNPLRMGYLDDPRIRRSRDGEKAQAEDFSNVLMSEMGFEAFREALGARSTLAAERLEGLGEPDVWRLIEDPEGGAWAEVLEGAGFSEGCIDAVAAEALLVEHEKLLERIVFEEVPRSEATKNPFMDGACGEKPCFAADVVGHIGMARFHAASRACGFPLADALLDFSPDEVEELLRDEFGEWSSALRAAEFPQGRVTRGMAAKIWSMHEEMARQGW